MSATFMEEYRDNKGCIDLFNHKRLWTHSSVITDCNEDLLMHCLKTNQPCAAGLDQLKGFY